MTKNELLESAYNAGSEDTYVAQVLNESAILYFDMNIRQVYDVPESERDTLLDDVINAYNEGFMFMPNTKEKKARMIIKLLQELQDERAEQNDDSELISDYEMNIQKIINIIQTVCEVPTIKT